MDDKGFQNPSRAACRVSGWVGRVLLSAYTLLCLLFFSSPSKILKKKRILSGSTFAITTEVKKCMIGVGGMSGWVLGYLKAQEP